ncbi:unnamed protein product [Porites lobata]|uniref:Uncharacterized protein n=1 Tax=Porites lobata TaxID=104759 RepID=A0ABN8RYI5_9CNID|nr:unnamed protein product [Porites lobata]
MPNIEFVKGIPTALEQDSYFDVNKRNLIVFDDQMIDASKDKRIVNLFTRSSHHRNLSVIYIVQNLFHQGKGSRSISLNSHYLVLFKNPRDKLQILTLAKQISLTGNTDFFLNQYEEAVKRPFGYLLIDLKTTTQDNCRLPTNVLPSEEGFNQAGFQENIPQELLKYLKQQTLSPVPLLPAMQEIQGNMDDVLSRNDLRDDEKAKRYVQLQNRYLAFKEQLNTRTRPEEIISTVPDLTSRTQDSSTATTAFSTPLNPFNVTPELRQAAISQKPDKESLTPPPPLNPAFLTPPLTVETLSQQGPKRKRRRIQFLNYLDDHKSHGKQLKKRRHKKFKPYKYSMGEDED